MKAKARIDAGVCGFATTACVACGDGQHVMFDIETDCEKIGRVGRALGEAGLIDAYGEISPAGPAVVMTKVQAVLTGCCAGCAVPVGLFKAMQVAAGLALAKDIAITLAKEE